MWCPAGFITDGNSKLVGNARIRQLRVRRNSCQVAASVQQLVPRCHAPYSWEVEDRGSYGPGWNRSTGNQTTSTPDPWTYGTQAELRTHPAWGRMLLYGGGGFAAELGPDLQNASRSQRLVHIDAWQKDSFNQNTDRKINIQVRTKAIIPMVFFIKIEELVDVQAFF